jgi:hypothetical protein
MISQCVLALGTVQNSISIWNRYILVGDCWFRCCRLVRRCFELGNVRKAHSSANRGLNQVDLRVREEKYVYSGIIYYCGAKGE